MQAPPLSDQLAWTTQVVHAVLQGRSLTVALATVPSTLRPGVQSLAFDALRQWGLSQALVNLLCQRQPVPLVQALLGVSLGLLSGSHPTGRNSYAPHTVVDQAVRAVRVLKLPTAVGGFVNACLRRMLREQADLMQQAQAVASARTQHPDWWVKRLQTDHPTYWEGALQASRTQAAMTLRVNTRRCSVSQLLKALHLAGVSAQPNGQAGITLDAPMPVEQLPGWADGWVSVQDAGAQLAAHVLMGDPTQWKGRRVLDACAAPGGKTAHLLELADVELLALDVDPQRCGRIHDNLQRLGLQATVQAQDASQPHTWWDGRPFDGVLLDAPCTASGIVRRHPDVPWLRRPTDVAQLSAIQRQLLTALWPTVAPGGVLLYCTCSLFRAEGEQQIERWMQQHPGTERLPAPGHLMPGGEWQINDNVWRDTDGFFYALLRKPL